MSNVRTLKKGEFLFKESEKIELFYLIQSGSISLCYVRPKKNIDLSTLSNSHILGEQLMIGQTNHVYSAMANVETKVLEIPLDTLRGEYESSPKSIKLLIKSQAERLRLTTNELKSIKMNQENVPCPDDQVPKIFASIFHTLRHKGTLVLGSATCSLDWNIFKQYAQRMFGESPKRLEQALGVLVKLKIARFEMGKSSDNPDGPDEIRDVLVEDCGLIENFFEFYQYHYFKNGKTEVLKSDDTSTSLVELLCSLTAKSESDRFGVVETDYSQFVSAAKDTLTIGVNNNHFARLEQKGFFVKRESKKDGAVVIQFDKKEAHHLLIVWKILRELEKWNERGYYDFKEKDEPKDLKKGKKEGSSGSLPCSACAAPLPENAKFCLECGEKVQKTA